MGPIIPKDKKPLVSASYLKNLLAARCKANSNATTTGTRRSVNSRKSAKTTKRRRATQSTSLNNGDGVKSRKRRKKVRRRKRTATRPLVKKPSKIASSSTHTQSDVHPNVDQNIEEQKEHPISESWSSFLSTLSSKPKKKKAKVEVLDKKPIVPAEDDIIVISDDDQPSTSRGRVSRARASNHPREVLDSSDDEASSSPVAVSRPKQVSPKTKRKAEAINTIPPSTGFKKPEPFVLTQEMRDQVQSLLTIPPIASSIAKYLPMRALNGLGRSCVLLRDVCNQEKQQRRRQNFDWILRSSIITTLDGQNMLNEQKIFGSLLSNINCEPEVVLVFCNNRILYESEMNVSTVRSPHRGKLKALADLISDLMPRNAGFSAPSKFIHIRTQSVLSPRPLPPANIRKVDHYGCKESSRDLCMLFVPKIDGVNVWQERLSELDLRRLLRDSGWLENRTHSHFLLPVLKELEILAPKFILMFSQRHPHYDSFNCPNFPILVLNPLHNYPQGRHAGNLEDNAVEWIAFGGNSVSAFQIFLAGDIRKEERKRQLRSLRDQFTAAQVMSGRMLLFYFRNVVKYEITPEETERLEMDITQLREEFPLIPIFGGGYDTAIGNEFTKNMSSTTFGKFSGGDLTTFVCALVLGF